MMNMLYCFTIPKTYKCAIFISLLTMLDISIFFKSLPRTSSICRKLLDRAIQSWTMQFITRWQQDLYIFTTSCHLVFPASSTTVGLLHPHHFRPCHLLYLSHIISLTSQSKHEAQCKSTSIRYIVCENLLHFLPKRKLISFSVISPSLS